MRIHVVLLCALAVAMLAGCGGGGGGTATPTAPFTVELTVPTGAAPAGVTPAATAKTADSFSPSLVGSSFVAAATCTPKGTQFNQAVTLTFHMTNAVTLGANEMLALGQLNSSSQIVVISSSPVTLSADKKTASAQLTSFDSTNNDYILAIAPVTTVELSVHSGAAPAGVTPTVASKTLAQTPHTGDYPVFVASAECLPVGTTFSQPVTLTFSLATAVADGKTVGLFEPNGSSWVGITDAQVNLSTDRKTATVQVDHFSSNGYFMLLTL